jgi:hypothetical protein
MTVQESKQIKLHGLSTQQALTAFEKMDDGGFSGPNACACDTSGTTPQRAQGPAIHAYNLNGCFIHCHREAE